jgi:hypothetical protein
MQISIEAKPYATLEIDALVSYVFEESDPVQGRVAELDQFANGLLKKLASGGELTGKTLEMTLVHAPGGLKAARSGQGSATNSIPPCCEKFPAPRCAT